MKVGGVRSVSVFRFVCVFLCVFCVFLSAFVCGFFFFSKGPSNDILEGFWRACGNQVAFRAGGCVLNPWPELQ